MALGLGLAACQRGLSVGFTTAASLVHELIEARDERRLLNLQKKLARIKLLIIDEPGFVPLSKTGAELLFEVFSQRYERGSVLVTTKPAQNRQRGQRSSRWAVDFAPRTVTCLRHRFPRASLPMSMVSSHEPGDRWRMEPFIIQTSSLVGQRGLYYKFFGGRLPCELPGSGTHHRTCRDQRPT